MTRLDDFDTAATAVRALVADLEADDLHRPTPYSEWDVRTLVGHLVFGFRMFATVLRGDEPPSPQQLAGMRRVADLGDDPLAIFDAAVGDFRTAADRPDPAGRTFATPVGPMPADGVVQMRINELVVHGWDLGQALHRPIEFPDHVVDRVLTLYAERLAGMPRKPGGPFAPEQPVPDGASTLDRVAALVGRTVATRSVLIDADELRSRLGSAVLLDVRWMLGRTDGRERYLTGHIPGAVYVDLDRELADPPSPRQGRHPPPSPERLQAAVRRWGVRTDSTVVAYDDNGNLAAARAWWLLRWAGLREVYLLDGGLQAWTAAGGPLATDDVVPAPGDAVVRPGRMPTLNADEAAGHPLLLDARAPERYRGDSEPIDPVAGHIPGAVNAPTGDNLDEDGRFRSAAALRKRFEALGVTAGQPVGVYCGSGVTAAHEIAALEHAGLQAALYPGSWSQWSNDPSRPVATGE